MSEADKEADKQDTTQVASTPDDAKDTAGKDDKKETSEVEREIE